jgi:Uma2 family endonuclease
VDLPEDGLRYELLEGALIVNPPPSGRHQWVSFKLTKLLNDDLPTGLAAVEAVGVRIPGGSVTVPDVLVTELPALLAASSGVLDATTVRLVVEIVSPSSQSMDRITKPTLYARAAIAAYWRVELGDGPAIHTYRLAGDTYELTGIARPGEPLVMDEPLRLTIDPSDLA